MSKTKILKYACYITNVSQALVANFSPLLFLTFNELYHISFSLLGFLVLINFITQLSVDLIFSFFSHKFNIEKTVKITPVLTVIGMVIYSVSPYFLPANMAFYGILVGTLVFSASGGLAEVLISPVIASLPSDDPDREMSKLHSVYAWGAATIIVLSTMFISVFGRENWQILALILTVIPLMSALLFSKSEIPKMETPERLSGVLTQFKNKKLWFCVVAIFLGGATECAMAQWSSGFLEKSLGVSKIWGDVFGVALFSLMLGFGRTLYCKYGKNITKILILGAVGANICYLIVAFVNQPFIGLIACVITGFCVSMLWPGCLIVASEYFPKANVFIFAMMAAGGDLGASLGPQLIGAITDYSKYGAEVGMKIGMAVCSFFPLLAIILYSIIHQDIKKRRK